MMFKYICMVENLSKQYNDSTSMIINNDVIIDWKEMYNYTN